MATSPPESPHSVLWTSPIPSTSQSSAGLFSPQSKPRLRFSRHYPRFYDDDDEDSDEDLENIDPRANPSTPKNATSSKLNADLSPTRFIIKGTVTPSRAAPLFARFSSTKRVARRPRVDAEESLCSEDSTDEDDGGAGDYRCPLGPNMYAHHDPLRTVARLPRHQKQQAPKSAFLNRNQTYSSLPHMSVPISNTFRHKVATQDVASYLLAIRSNSLGHLPWASSTRGITGGSSGRGVLGVSRMLGAGGGSTSSE
jgi:hypothetical protein